ncbi:peptidoglycan-binding domain-containing protein [Virgibacillus natechei]
MSIDNQYINAESRKRWIEMLQKQLIRENPSALPDYGVDGSYGPETTDWVSRFQERKGLVVDGLTGPETLGRLREDIVQLPGTSGRGVEILQEDLLYFYIEQSAVDGSYGPSTEQGVRDFQFYNNLVVDGEAGPDTLYTFDELITTILVQQGDSNSLVQRIQEQLNEQDSVDISIEVDGSYGPETEQAVEDFQEANEQYIDGIAGPVTMNQLDLEATHPLSMEELREIVQYEAEDPESLPISVQEGYITALENNSVFKETLPIGSSNSINATAFLEKGSYSFGEDVIIIHGEIAESFYSFISYMDKESNELLLHNLYEASGDAFADSVLFTSYDVEGNSIESLEQRWVDFSNDNLEQRIDITNQVNELQILNGEYYLHSTNEALEDTKCFIKLQAVCLFIGALGLTPPTMLALYTACDAAGTLYTTLYGCGIPE